MKKWRFNEPEKGAPKDIWVEIALVDEAGKRSKRKAIHIDDVKEWLELEDKETKIKDLPLGQSGYIVPWAINNDDGTLTLNPEYLVNEYYGGTATALIHHARPGRFTVELKLGNRQ
jgi:hypothetical protein